MTKIIDLNKPKPKKEKVLYRYMITADISSTPHGVKQALGIIMPHDIGKLAHSKDGIIWQVENEEQFTKRVNNN